MANYEFLTGGSDGTATTQNWIDALAMCELIDASFVCVVTGEAAIHAALATHVKYMSGVDGKNERQGGCGSLAAATEAEQRAAAQGINSNLVDYFGGEHLQFDEFGDEKYYPGFVWACAVKGMQAGNEITFAPTKKSMTMIKAKKVLSKTELEKMILAGVQVAQPDDQLGGIRVVRSVTTFQGTNIIANESSAMRSSLFIAKDHRAAVEGFIGAAGTNLNLSAIAVRAEEKLADYVEAGWFVVDPATGDAYRNFQFTVDADVVKVTYEGTLSIPINFIFTTHNFTVLGSRG